MKMHSRFLFLYIALFFFSSCASYKKGQAPNSTRIAFYNVENLFDLKDDPNKLDEDFTPSGKQEWTTERYQTKLDRIHQVVEGMDYPTLLGVCEVENKDVLNDLCSTKGFSSYKYEHVHFESPDRRGIDVALLYQKKHFKVKNKSYIRLDFPEEIVPDMPDYTSRDILVVEGVLNRKSTVYVIVAHFPSRYGGVEKSEPKRVHVAGYVRRKIDVLKKANLDAQFIIMGDFNDEPTNKSIAETLHAQPIPNTPNNNSLYNCHAQLKADGRGSYNYRGNWNMLDQVILSGHFFQKENAFQFESAHIYKGKFLFYEDKKHGPRPSRTYGGPKYFGGYSDHLPVYIDLKVNN